MAKIRSFLAVELPKEIIGKLGGVQDDLKPSGPYVKWVRPESIHLTLKFFGNIEEKIIDNISLVVKGVTSNTNVFNLEVIDIGVFPNMSRPKVIWVGVKFSDGTLDILQKEVGAGLEKIGFEHEGREFNPHLTLGRVKSLKEKRRLVEQIERFEGCELGSFKVEYLSLLKSDLRPTGAVYTKLRTFPLKTVTK